MHSTLVGVKSAPDLRTAEDTQGSRGAAPLGGGAQQLLSDASVALTTSLVLDETIQRVARVIVPGLADWCIIDLVDNESGQPIVRRAAAVHADPQAQPLLDEMARRFPPRLDRPTLSRPVIDTGRSMLVPDASDELIEQVAPPEQAALVRRIGVRSCIVVPLRARERLLGVVALFSSRRSYTPDDLALAEELGRRIAIAVDNALLFTEVRESAERLERLHVVTSALSRAVTADEVAATVIREAVAALHATEAIFCLMTPDRAWLEIMRQVGLPEATARDWRRFAVDGPFPLSEAVRTGSPIFLENREAVVTRYPELREANARAIAGAWVALPLTSNGAAIGGLAFGFAHPREFAPVDRAFALTLAQQCAQALERARLYEAEHAARMEAEDARHRADEANRTKTEFLAVMSHELRTPLNAIAGYAELLEIGIHGPLNDSQREAVARIQRSERHLLGLINDVLNFAKLEAGHVRLELGPVAVHETLAALEALVAPQVREKQLGYRYVPCSSDVAVHADSEKVRQILLNLLSNAIKFTEPEGRIVVTCTIEPNVIRLHVSDTGPGIPADKLERIFEPFVQLHPGRTRRYEGTGLGLAISRDLARAMNGEITVESSAAGGSRFTLTLPRHV